MITVSRPEHRHRRAFYVPTISLLDRNHGDIARLIFPDALNVGHAGFLQRQPNVRSAECHRFSGDARRHAEDDRIIAIKDVLDLHHRFIACARRIVAGPLAEGSFGAAIFIRRQDESLDRQLGSRGNRQAGLLAANKLYRLTEQPAGDFQFRHTPGFVPTGDFGEYRILSEADHDGTWFSLRPILLPDEATMFTG